MLYQDISEYDPEVNDLIEKETWRQFSGLELIASEVSIADVAVPSSLQQQQLTSRT